MAHNRNSALASILARRIVPWHSRNSAPPSRQREVLLISQWENTARFSEASTLPSFLYLLSQDEAAQMSDQTTLRAEWVPGRFARTRAAESPGRVVHSAKSWLCHHSVDRNASFLPWRSDEIPSKNEYRPSALPLCYLHTCARHGTPGLPAKDCGSTNRKLRLPFRPLLTQRPKGSLWTPRERPVFLTGVRLLEEPQAAFYWWLERTIGRKCRLETSSPAPRCNMSWSSTLAGARPTSLSLRLLPDRTLRCRRSSGSP